jgi:hypothetical protein
VVARRTVGFLAAFPRTGRALRAAFDFTRAVDLRLLFVFCLLFVLDFRFGIVPLHRYAVP